MAENMAKRVARLVSGSFQSLVDALEDTAPKTIMEESIREVDGAIDDVRAELGRLIANKHLSNKRLFEENRKHTELGQKIELAIKQNRDDLAEAGIAEQMDIEAKVAVLEASIDDDAANEQELERYIAALLAKRREMESELRAFAAAQTERTSDAGSSISDNPTDRKVEAATSAFDRTLDRASGLPGLADGGSGASVKDLAELEELARKDAVARRLKHIKESL